jgi:transcriptional regulator with XRE-family HTH domain
MTTAMKPLGERIRELRDQQDFSLRELARKLQVSAAFLSDIELGRRHPSDEILERLAGFLKTTIQDLRAHDARAPIQELKRLAAANPAYGFALRGMVEEKVTPEELLKFLKSRSQRGKKG